MTPNKVSFALPVMEALSVQEEPTVRDFVALLKPRVMSLVVFTGWVGLYLAPGNLHPLLALTTVLCIAIGAGASGAINMWYDRDIDLIMKRTRSRPLPSGRMSPEEALSFGVILAAASVLVLGVVVSWLAAALLAFTIGFYVFVYTIWLKRCTAHNIVIGGAAGALPPMIGWAAVTGDISLASISLFLIIFMWTPPHFWALALYSADDYARAGIPMLPVVRGEVSTKNHIVAYTLALIPLTLMPFLCHIVGKLYVAGAFALGSIFVLGSLRLRLARREASLAYAKQLFAFSILYLFLLFLLMVVDKVG